MANLSIIIVQLESFADYWFIGACHIKTAGDKLYYSRLPLLFQLLKSSVLSHLRRLDRCVRGGSFSASTGTAGVSLFGRLLSPAGPAGCSSTPFRFDPAHGYEKPNKQKT